MKTKDVILWSVAMALFGLLTGLTGCSFLQEDGTAGGIAFQLRWIQSNPGAESAARVTQPNWPETIQTIVVTVKSSAEEIANSELGEPLQLSFAISDGFARIDDIPAGTGYIVVVEGFSVSIDEYTGEETANYAGSKTDVVIVEGEVTQLGVIDMIGQEGPALSDGTATAAGETDNFTGVWHDGEQTYYRIQSDNSVLYCVVNTGIVPSVEVSDTGSLSGLTITFSGGNTATVSLSSTGTTLTVTEEDGISAVYQKTTTLPNVCLL